MRHFSTLLVIFFISTLMSFAQQEEIKTNKEDKNHPEIFFEKTTHDYGEMKHRGDGTCEFTFKNTGKQPLLLTNVRSSCGCTTPDWPKEPIKPGDEGTIKVKYNTIIIGPFQKTIRVYSNAKSSSIVLTIKGKVLRPEQINK